MSINFLAEIAERSETIILPTPSNEHHSTGTSGIIYELDISNPPTDSYWLDWGGHFNHFRGTNIMLRYDDYLGRADCMDDMKGMPNSFFIDGRTVYIHLPRHPWLFPEHSTSFEHVIPFLSNAVNPGNPSNNDIEGLDIRPEVRLEIPNFTVRLSDNIAGMTLNQGFSIALKNSDGFFDDEYALNLFNTPLYLRKTATENPEYGDFRLIRNGLVENKNTTFDGIQISVADRFRALGEPVYNVIRQADFPGITVQDNALNRPIPIVFGTSRINPVKLTDNRPDGNTPGVAVNHYMTAENTTGVLSVHDRNGASISFSFNPGTKVITVPNIIENGNEARIEAAEAIVTGNTENRIGQVIRWLLENRAGIVFNETNFNVSEYNAYADNSFPINIAITRGNIRRAIDDVLKSDMAFLIQQTDGRFTLRSYAGRNTYALHDIDSWVVTKRPDKDYGRAQDSWFNSCIIEWVSDGGETISELYTMRAVEAERRYRRRVQKTFETNLTAAADARILAGILSDRYTSMRQVVKLSVGINTAGFELLDRVRVDLDINGRKFSRSADFIITAINHSQDILTLEEID